MPPSKHSLLAYKTIAQGFAMVMTVAVNRDLSVYGD